MPGEGSWTLASSGSAALSENIGDGEDGACSRRSESPEGVIHDDQEEVSMAQTDPMSRGPERR